MQQAADSRLRVRGDKRAHEWTSSMNLPGSPLPQLSSGQIRTQRRVLIIPSAIPLDLLDDSANLAVRRQLLLKITAAREPQNFLSPPHPPTLHSLFVQTLLPTFRRRERPPPPPITEHSHQDLSAHFLCARFVNHRPCSCARTTQFAPPDQRPRQSL